MIYSAILYRSNHEDYVRGCVRGSSDSDKLFYTSDSKEGIIKLVLEHQLKFTLEYENNLDYTSYDIDFLINGMSISSDNNYDTPEHIYNEICNVSSEYMFVFENQIKDLKNAAIQKKAEEERKKKQELDMKKEQDERKLLAKLKNKYESKQ